MKKLLFISITILLFWNCTEVKEWSDPTDVVPPGKISQPEYQSLPGGVMITYNLPDDKDILGVKAIYSLKEGGEVNKAFSSAFRDTITIEGFHDTLERTVSLICIDKSRNESEPVTLSIKPSTPPVHLIRETFKVIPTFGGVYATWDNEYNADIAITFYAADSTGDLVLYDTHYSRLSDGEFSLRGFDDSERKFHVEIRDKWQNYAAPFDVTLKPLFEEEISPRNDAGELLWSLYGWNDGSAVWRGDVHTNTTNTWLVLIDGITVNRGIYWSTGMNYLVDFDNSFPSTQVVRPMYLTFDLGRPASISRFKLWMRGREPAEPYLATTHRYFQQGAWKYYEIWGSEQPPKQPGDFSSKKQSLSYWTEWPELGGTDSWKNDWVKLADCANLPVSGAEVAAKLTVDDIIAADNGHEVVLAPEQTGVKVRYIRFVIKENWEKARTNMQLVEIKFFGSTVK